MMKNRMFRVLLRWNWRRKLLDFLLTGHVVVDEESHEKALADSIRADLEKFPSGLAPSKRNTEGEHPDATSPKKTAHE